MVPSHLKACKEHIMGGLESGLTPHTSHRTPHTSPLTPASSHLTPNTSRRTHETGGLARWLAEAPAEARRASSNGNVGGKAGRFSNRKLRLEGGWLGSISEPKCGRVRWEGMMDSTGLRGIFAIRIRRNTKTPMDLKQFGRASSAYLHICGCPRIETRF